MKNEHDNLTRQKCDFRWTVVKRFKKPMQRQLSEAIRIDSENSKHLLNLKNEYFKANIKGIDLSRKQYICQYCSRISETSTVLKEHITKFHKQYDCEKCDYRAFGLDSLKRHEKEMHSSTT